MPLRRGTLAIIALALAGCGGGGGGSDPAPEPQPPVAAAFRLSSSNVSEASGVVLLLVEEATAAANIVIEAAERLSAQSASSISMDCRFNDADGSSVTSHDDNDGDGRISAGDSIRFQEEDCEDRDTEIRLDVTAASIVESSIASLAGRLSYSRVPVGQTAASGPEDNRGSLTLDYRRTDTGSTRSHTDIDMSLSTGGMTDRLTGGDLQNVIAGMQYSVEFEGRIQIDSLDGSFGFRTTTPFSGQLGDFPTTGELRLETQDSAAVVAPAADVDVANQHAAYRVDTTGTGQFSDPVSVPWVDWIAGTLFNWHGFIRNLIIEPRRPVTTDSLSAVADIYNPQQKQLSFTYEWLIGNLAYTFDPRPEILPSEYTAKGSIGLRLIVSDGTITDVWTLNRTILNSAPRLDAAIGPDAPDTTHDIMVDHVTSDADADGVSVSYRWHVNGQLMEDVAGATLPAGRHRKNDVVRVVVTAADGESTTSQSHSVTIVDAVPRVQLSGVPGAVSYASPVEFTAAFSDPDGDDVSQFRFGMEYGPPGMNVDPVTGQVTWPAKIPLFDGEMDVAWRVGSSNGEVVGMSGSLRVVDSDRAYPLIRTAIRPPRKDRLWVDDYDADGDNEVLVLDERGNLYTLEWDGASMRQSWVYWSPVAHPYGVDAVATADIDGDGPMEMFLHAEDTMTRLDGSTRRVVNSTSVPPAIDFAGDLALADLTGDGPLELVYLTEGEVYESSIVVLSADDFSLLWRSEPGRFGHYVHVANVDRDPALEIVVSGGYVFDGSTYEEEWRHESTNSEFLSRFGSENDVVSADIDGDGVEEVFGYLDKNEREPVMEVFRIPSGELIGPSSPIQSSVSGKPLIADMDGDGVPEILGRSERFVRAFSYDPQDESFVELGLHQPRFLPSAIGTGDMDGDGDREIVLGTENWFASETGAYAVLELEQGEFHTVWTQPGEHLTDGEFIGGRLVSDGVIPEDRLLFVSNRGEFSSSELSEGPQVVFLSPSSGDLEIGPRVDGALPPNFRRWSVTDAGITDYDRDGRDELFVAMHRNYDIGRLAVFDPFLAIDEWAVEGEPVLSGFLSTVDLNGDGFEDFLTRAGGYDVVNDTPIWKRETEFNTMSEIGAGDLEGDGRTEIVYVDAFNRLVILSPDTDGEYSERIVPLDHQAIFHLIVADTDGDGKDEILLASREDSDVASEGIRRFGANGELLNSFSVAQAGRWEPDRLFVLPGAGRKQLAVSFKSTGRPGARLEAYDPLTGTRLWGSPDLLAEVSPNSVHYIEVEGEPRLVIATGKAVYMTQ